MLLYEDGKKYWEIIKRVREHDNRPMITRAAISELNDLIATTSSNAVRKRAINWIAAHNQTSSPGNNPEGAGPRYA